MIYMKKMGSLVLVCVIAGALFAGAVCMSSDSARALAVSGQQSGTWALADSPIYVEGDVFIEDGNTLVIEAGVEVYVNGSYEILVNGTLIADGTELLPITITSNQSVEAPGDWIGIKVNMVPIPLVNGQAILNYTNISYASVGLNITGSSNPSSVTNCTFYMNEDGLSLFATEVIPFVLYAPSANNVIQNSTFLNNSNGTVIRYGVSNVIDNNKYISNEYGITTSLDFMEIFTLPSSSDNYIANNTIRNNTELGISFFGNFLAPTLTNNVIYNNTLTGSNTSIQLAASIKDTVSYNNITNNNNGIFLGFSSNNTIFSNNISDNVFGGALALILSPDNQINNNEIYNNGLGIYTMGFPAPGMESSNRNYIGNNTVNLNMMGIGIMMAENNTLFNNTVNYSVVEGVILQNANHTNVWWNNISFSIFGTGLNASDSNNLSIADNTIVSNQMTNLDLRNIKDSTVSRNNALFSISDVGLSAADSSNLSIMDNVVLLNPSANIALDNITDSKISGNNASLSAGGFGIVLSSSTWNDLYDNVGYGNAQFGLLLNYADNITVENNTYSQNAIGGIGLISSNYTLISNVTVTNTNVGVYVESSSMDTIMNTNASFAIGGVYLNNSVDITLDNVTVYNNISSQPYGIYLFNTSYSTVNDNFVTGCSLSGLTIQESSNNTVTNNIINGNVNGATMVQSSLLNDFSWNNVSSNILNGYLFDGSSNMNTLSNEDMWDNPVGVNVSASSDILAVNSTIMSVQNDFALYNDAHATALNSTFNLLSYYEDTLSDLTVQWFLDVKVVNSTLAPLSGADLFVNDAFSAEIYNSTTQGATDASGYVRWIIATEYVENQSVQVYYTPHNATAWWSGKTGYNESTIDTSMEVMVVIDTAAPNIVNTNAQPSPQEVHGYVNVTANVTDASPITEVWVNITNPVGGSTNTSIIANYNPLTGEYYYNTTYDNLLWIYNYNVWVSDSNSNWANESGTFVIEDTTPPDISLVSASPVPQEVDGYVNVTANVTDNFDTNLTIIVSVNITDPSGGTTNQTMIFDSATGKFYYNTTYSILGAYGFTIWANDTSDNWASASDSFAIQDTTPPTITDVSANPDPQEVGGSVNITANVTDNVKVDEVWIDIVGEGNFSMKYDSGSGLYYYSDSYSPTDTYSYTIWANDTSDNWNSTSSSFTIQDTIPPVSNPGSDMNVTKGTEVTFDGSASSDNSGEITDYTWTITKNGETITTISGVGPSYTFDTLGNYTVTLKVTDPAGLYDEESITVTVTEEEQPPPAGDFLKDYWWLILVIVAIAIVLILVLLLTKKKKKPEEEILSPPPPLVPPEAPTEEAPSSPSEVPPPPLPEEPKPQEPPEAPPPSPP